MACYRKKNKCILSTFWDKNHNKHLFYFFIHPRLGLRITTVVDTRSFHKTIIKYSAKMKTEKQINRKIKLVKTQKDSKILPKMIKN